MAKNMTKLSLSHNNLIGRITFTHWKELQSLVNLDMCYNSLEGSIPTSLFSLPILKELQLSNNHFSGHIHEFFNVSSYQLNTLDLSSNNLEGPIPLSFSELRGLIFLLLSSNNFRGSLKVNMILQLTNLLELNLSYNNLFIDYGANSSLWSILKIETLILAFNKLKTFPNFLRNQPD